MWARLRADISLLVVETTETNMKVFLKTKKGYIFKLDVLTEETMVPDKDKGRIVPTHVIYDRFTCIFVVRFAVSQANFYQKSLI